MMARSCSESDELSCEDLGRRCRYGQQMIQLRRCDNLKGAGGGLPCGLGRFLTRPVINDNHNDIVSHQHVLGK
jgi:hypothetical protein